MELYKNSKTFQASTKEEWREWLAENHQSEKSVWLIIYHKGCGIDSVYYDEAVEQAICFGWIDSIANKRDEKSKYQFFAQRKPKSNWSKANRERAEKMMHQGEMHASGQKLIALAKETGTWEALVDVKNSVIPDDLQKLLHENPLALKNFMSFPPSSKRIILEWILNAKKEETRQKRMEETVRLAAENIKANHYRQ
jgi:uncharacterized protein YdeI (YjbR/CyaY-like superfamily)